MSNSKTSNAPKRAQNVGGMRPPQQGQSAPRRAPGSQRVENVDEAIAKAQAGRVNVSPVKAVEMAGQLYTRRQYAQAQRVCRQIIQARPANADAHNILGVTLAALGNADEAIASLRRAIKLNAQAPSYHANLGEILRQNNRLDEAEQALEAAVRLDPDNAQALNNLGIIRYEQRRFKDAVDYYQRALAIRPQMSEALNNLGNAHRMTGDIDAAIQAYQDALVVRANYPEAYNNLGTLLQQDKRLEEAEHALRKAIQQNPKYIEAHNNLAQLLAAQKQEVEALRILGEALKIAPNSIQTLLITSRIQNRRNAHGPAEGAARMVLKQEPENAEALTILGQVLHETDRYDEALEVLERALKSRPDSPEALNFYGVALKSMGRLEEAREYILKALKLNDAMYGAYANLNDLVDFSEGIGDELFGRMEAIFESVKNPEADQFLALHFAYAKALEDRGQHEKALEHYITGGRMKRAQLNYTESETFGFFDSIRASFPKEVFENRKWEGSDDDRPTFIVGMPRSGSTLVEQILSSHPDVYGAGEVKYLSRALGQLRDRFPSLPKFPQMIEKITPAQLELAAKSYQQALSAGAGDAKRITDKLLTNYFFVGLINLLFPKAKIIHTRRDPVDTCLSGFTKLFKDDMPHSYDLGELGRYYGKYIEIMNHWEKVLPEGTLITVQYEEVVADTEGQARRLIDFLGLPWNDKCVDFHKSDRPVKTASVAQVRKPIYKTSVQRWKKYGTGLQPLVDAIESSVPGKPARKSAAKAEKAAEPKKSKSKAKENA
ncbi:tetratricopeptide repeat-containing sulfotransferase family protein [Sphingomonas hankyongi]|uniref:Tetratricopeptide repeat protein n=1 Tax=Sphingomonas hankyongi TaxID=2908209 RepID=A0ABT0S0F6_9SPHN|nr:tetratricopeptide repeat-containing sulfotransferase family protein [Sphingomonas hankyongi]MCL6729338.1 tetratricopeptide repeat protein [Sphingomonas hankyongi]